MTEAFGFRAAKQVVSGTALSRRDLLALIGTLAGSATMYHAMSSLAICIGSQGAHKGPIAWRRCRWCPLGVDPWRFGRYDGGIELRKAGYRVQVLECTSRRGRPQAWTTAQVTQKCPPNFWRLHVPANFRARTLFQSRALADSYHHRAVLLITAKRFGNVASSLSIQLNHNALFARVQYNWRSHQRIRDMQALDFQVTGASELLSPRRPSRVASMKPSHRKTKRFCWRR